MGSVSPFKFINENYIQLYKYTIIKETFWHHSHRYRNTHILHKLHDRLCEIILMDQEELSGEVASEPQRVKEDDYCDFGDIDFNDIEDYEPAMSDNYEEEELSDYGGQPQTLPTTNKLDGNTKGTRQKKAEKPNKREPKVRKPRKSKAQQADAYNDQEQLSGQEQQSAGQNINDHFFDNQSDNGYMVEERPQVNSTGVQKSNRNAEQQDLSDYEDQQDEEVSQYHHSLFGDLQSRDDLKSVMSHASSGLRNSFKVNSSNNIALSDDEIKESVRTGDELIVKKGFDPMKRELFHRFKDEKREKLGNSSVTNLSGEDRNLAISKREKVQNKKRFSKKQLELVSRKFSDYYSYETKRGDDLPKVNLRQIGAMFDLGHATIHKLYAEWMDDPYFYERIKRYDKYRKQTKNPQRKLTLDRLDHIARLIKQNPFLTQYELCVELNKIEDLKVIKCGKRQNMTRTIVGKLLRMGKFRKKRVKCIPKEKNTSKSLEKRYEYCLKYKEILERRAKVYFLDESGFNLYMTRDKAWSRPNEEITVNCPISKGKRFSLIANIGDDGVAHWRFIEGNYRKFQYLDFIRELFQKLNEHKSPDEPQQRWIVLDNCAIHDKQQTINLAKQYGINVLYLPSYSPQLNPIENWFHEIKCKLKKINYSGEKQLFNIMQRILKQYQQHDFSNYYHGSLKFVEKGLKKEKF